MFRPPVSGFVTNLYVIMVPLILGVATGRWPSPLVGIGVVIVVGGLALLSLYGKMGFGLGDALTLIADAVLAVHILAVGHMSTRMKRDRLVQLQLSSVCAVLGLICASSFRASRSFPGWSATREQCCGPASWRHRRLHADGPRSSDTTRDTARLAHEPGSRVRA